MSNLLQQLNKEQVRAVTTTSQFCRVIAGAGAGKTRVLTNRFAYILREWGVLPSQVLAITFTNKAAGEIKERIERFLPEIEKRQLNVFTFHGFCARFLRQEIECLSIPKSFTIIDEDDQKSIIKKILKEEGYNTRDALFKELPNFISYHKNLGLYPDDIKKEQKYIYSPEKVRLYRLYQEELERCHQLDFDDLILKALEILNNHPDVRQRWSRHFLHILIDEFQDTNDLQYELVRLLMNESTSLYVVGDPDQNIYTWRGANLNILLNLKATFPNIETILLEQNYRSTMNVLNPANNLIRHNKKRIEKNLFTVNEEGERVRYFEYYRPIDEARAVVDEIIRLSRNYDYTLKDIAIMYRSNYLTLSFEKILMERRIPYTIYGGLKFYQRKEVKDILAYLRLILDHKDNVSFDRIINVPKRGIGDSSLIKMHKLARDNNLTYFEYIDQIEHSDTNIPLKAFKAMKDFVNFIKEMKKKIDELTIGEVLHHLIDSLHFEQYLKESEDNGEERYENVETLVNDITSTIKNNKLTIEQYLENTALMAAQDYVKESDSVTLMTVHTAKGLEFPVVFLVALNDGVFPNLRAVQEDEENIEEERRICYVAITRARERLYVSSTMSNIQGMPTTRSQFVDEAKLVKTEGKKPSYITNERFYKTNGNDVSRVIKKATVVTKLFESHKQSEKNVEWHIGDTLLHPTFGKGVVIGVEDTLISVRFDDGNIKKLLGNHASLTKIERDKKYEA